MQYICFTGHRPRGLPWGYNEKSLRCFLFKKRLMRVIEEVTKGTTTFITGMAMGVDMIAGELIAKFKENYENIFLEAAVPCKTQAQHWSYDYLRRYDALLNKCNKVTYLNDHYTPYCMKERNRYMVDKSDIVIAVWNGSPKTGTASTLHYARSKNKKVIIIKI